MKAAGGNSKRSKKYVFFISHSTADICSYVKGICEIFELVKINTYFADRDAPLGEPLPEEIKKAIRQSEIFLVIVTKNSRKSAWVNQEIGYALGKGVPVVALKKGRIRVKGLIETSRYVPLKDNAFNTVKEVFAKLEKTPVSKTAETAIGAFIGALEALEKYGGINQ